MKRIGMYAVGLVLLGTLTACGNSQDTALSDLLNRPALETDALPAEAADQSDVKETTTRLAGQDTNGRDYFVGTNDNDDPCLVIVNNQGLWGSSCGRLGEFFLSFDGVSAWLGTEPYEEYVATETLGDLVSIAPN